MKVCALTMVYRDYWALAQWYRHYAAQLAPENLYIIAHGADPQIDAICKGGTVITVPRDDLTGFDRVRNELLNQMQDELGAHYDWVIRTDVDELICMDPALFPCFSDAFAAQGDVTCLFALGMDVVEAATDAEIEGDESVLSVRHHAVFSGHYSKAFAVRSGTHLMRHGVVQSGLQTFTMPQGLYLLHLKYANVDALLASNLHRTAIANGKVAGLPGNSWKDAERRALRFLQRFEALPYLPWSEAVQEAYDAIAGHPETDADKGVLRAKSIQVDHRTTLPDWFASL